MAEQVPATRPMRVEIRVDGRIRFANNCYLADIVEDGETVTFTANMKPEMVDAPPPPTHRFGDDLRDGDVVIEQVHSGRRR